MQDPDHSSGVEGRFDEMIGAAFASGDAGGTGDDRLVRSILRATSAGGSPIDDATKHLEARYELLEEIARGGMGVVRRARDRVFGRCVAIKTVRTDAPGRSALMQRLADEALLCSQLEHPGIVPVHDFGRTERGEPYLVMRLVQGRTLAEILGDRDGSSRERIWLLGIFEQICRAVAHAHDRDVIHRDLKPRNVMVGRSGETQVMDWGLAKIAAEPDDADDAATRDLIQTLARGSGHAGVIGTASYMSPEQARGGAEPVDRRSDVFSLGAMLLEILTGRTPFEAESLDGALARARAADLDDVLDALRTAGVDEELGRLVRDCIAPERDRRPENAGAVAGRVADYLQRLEERKQKAEVAEAVATTRAADAQRARRLAYLVATLIVATILVSGGAWIAGDRRAREARSSVSRRVAATLERARVLRDQSRTSGGLDRVRLVEASAAARAALALSPDDRGEAQELLEALEREIGEVDAAARARREIEALHAHLGDERPLPDLDARYVELFGRLGMEVDAVPIDETAHALSGSRIRSLLVRALDEWSEVRRRMASTEAADRLTALALLVDDDPWRTRLRRAVARRSDDDLREIATSVDGSAAISDADSLDLLARSLVRTGMRRQGIDVYRAANAAHPEHDRICHDLGVLLMGEEAPDWTEILRLFAMALARKPGDAHYRCDVAVALRQLERHEEALAVLDAANEDDADYARAWAARGEVLYFLGRLEEAAAAFRASIDHGHDVPSTRANLGITLGSMNRDDEALTHLERAHEMDPDFAPAVLGIARILKVRDRAPDALRMVEEFLLRHPRHTDAQQWSAELQLETAHFELAVERIEAALALDGGRPESWAVLAFTHLVVGRIEEGEAAARRLRELGRVGWAEYLLGVARFKAGDFEGALDHLETAEDLEFDHDRHGTVQGIRLPLVDQFLKTLDRLEDGSALALSDPGYADYAVMLTLRGRHEESLDAFLDMEEAAGMPLPAPLVEFAIRAALRAGRREQARRWLDAAVTGLEESGAEPREYRELVAHHLVRATRVPSEADAPTERAAWKALWTRITTLSNSPPKSN